MDKRGYPQDATNPPVSLNKENESESNLHATLANINQILMEDDVDENYSIFQDSLALQHAEKSFYDVIGENYLPPPPPSSLQYLPYSYPTVDSPDQSLSSTYSDYSFSSGTSTSTADSAEYNPNPLIPPPNFPIPPTNYVFNFQSTTNNRSGNPMAGFQDPTILLSESEFLQFKRAMFLSNQYLSPFIIDPAYTNTTFSPSFRTVPQVVIKTEEEEFHEEDVSQGSKILHHQDQDEVEDGRSTSMEGNELSELFDKILLLGATQQTDESSTSSSSGGKSLVRRQSNSEEVVDLRTLLLLCAQAISSNDLSTANQLLKQIKQHCSRMGDGTQRLAYFFGNALEARLDGTGPMIYSALSSKKNTAADMIKAYQVYASACPFDKLAIIFANNSIWNKVKEVETLHIIDFGVGYGFKWPAFINRLSKREGGPPKLRITGIEFPQRGLRIQETEHRLASYCNRFNVPFQFNAIVKRWETIQVEDLKIKENEFVAVNCLFRFDNLLDETVVMDDQRGAVLSLIKKANPGIFVQSIVNGCYDAPFFVTRFREALYHYSAMFDLLDNNVAREDPMRLMVEEEFCGREIVNIIACEGCDRVERPGTYKQWQYRNMRGGFRQLPMDYQIINKLRDRLRNDAYNSNFMLEVDGNWMLQGWKGRILYASSCWVPE
ncbi:hypothetical protein SESBI_24714 [Sesbania bispinosa]|nr:hypothetical protein SESBI_24714 [Sesbania bispinosa]